MQTITVSNPSARMNQECFEEAFVPTLQTLFNAPASSPLADVDVSNVAELLVDLTRPSGLKAQKISPDYQVSVFSLTDTCTLLLFRPS